MVIVALIVFGLTVGSFTCVIIDRLPLALDEPNRFGDVYDTRPWKEVLGGRSRCSSCGTDVTPSQNIPVFGWLRLRGKCGTCRAPIPGFHPLVELLVPALWVLLYIRLDSEWLMLPLLALIPSVVAISFIDLRTMIVPTKLVWPTLGVCLLLMAIVALRLDEWDRFYGAAAGLAVLAGPLFILWLIFPAGMGWGDIRLATLLGAVIGFYAGMDWQSGAWLGLLCLLSSSLIGIAYALIGFGARGMKARIPFGPALVTAAIFCIGWSTEILEPFV